MMINKPNIKVRHLTSWIEVLNLARWMNGKEAVTHEPSKKWKGAVLISEHSPIKVKQYVIDMEDLRQWVGVHLLRHDYTLPYIQSQRVDRNEHIDEMIASVKDLLTDEIKYSPDFNKRDYVFQGEANNHKFYVNAQTLINISRRRLCATASKETRQAWQMVKDYIATIDPEMARAMVSNCVYRGFCPEFETCGYCFSANYEKEVKEYRQPIIEWRNKNK